MTLDQITQVLEELQCTTSTDDPEAFTFGKICFKCSVFFFCAQFLCMKVLLTKCLA
jgi:hypothetical protein